MKLGQLIESNNKNIFFKNHAENEAARLVPETFSLFEKALYEVKVNDLELSFSIFG